MNYHEYSAVYKENLLHNIIPFWYDKSPDRLHGGYFTCLDRAGKVFDTDKFTWLQCRQVWTFAMLYNRVEQNQEWLDFALHGARFLSQYGMDKGGNWYFSLTRDGKPLTQPHNIFSDCFAAMAYAQLYVAAGDAAYAQTAKDTFLNILSRKDHPKGRYSKAYLGSRTLQGFSLPMILTNLVLEMETVLEADLVEQIIDDGIDNIMNKFYHPEFGVILENVEGDGRFSDSFEGRLVNPGHGLEAMWFIIDLAVRRGDQQLLQKAVDISLGLMEFGWDKTYGGIYYFMDVKGHPPLQLEWDQKLWWVHLEAMVVMLKGFLQTGRPACWRWFEELHAYCWQRFSDEKYGEWYGYLTRQGEILLPLKGGKWKGCFHVPRAFYQAWTTLEDIHKKQALGTV